MLFRMFNRHHAIGDGSKAAVRWRNDLIGHSIRGVSAVLPDLLAVTFGGEVNHR
jgi:hypothetical protein